MASRLARPGAVAALMALKGATGAMVSNRDRIRSLQEKEADRSRAFQDSLIGMGVKQQMDLAGRQQTDLMDVEKARAIRQNEIENPIPPTEEDRARTEWYRAQAAGVPQKAETAEDRARAALEARVADDREQLERTAMMAPDPTDGIAYLKAGAKLIGQERVAELTAILKEKKKQQDHESDVARAKAILLNPANADMGTDQQKKVAKGLGLSDAELYQITGQGQEYTPGYQPSALVDVTPTPSVTTGMPAPSGPSDADLARMAGAAGATNAQEAADWRAQAPAGPGDNTAGLTPEEIADIRLLAQQWGVDFNTARTRADAQLQTR